MDTKISADRLSGSIAATKAANQGKQPTPVPEIITSSNDVVDLSEIAKSLSPGVLKVFNSLSTEDKTQLADLVDRGAISGQELSDGILASLKSNRKRQLWKLVAEKHSSLSTSIGGNSPKELRAMTEEEINAIIDERGLIIGEMARLLGKPGTEAQSNALSERLQKLADRDQQIRSAVLMDNTKPMTFVGARGTFFSANWVEGNEAAALDKLTSLGALSLSIQQAITDDAKKTAKDNLVAYSINQDGQT